MKKTASVVWGPAGAPDRGGLFCFFHRSLLTEYPFRCILNPVRILL